jgi:CRP-like cAMP-binding protein
VRVATLYAGDVLGWSSLTADDSKQFQARALEPVLAIAFDGARLLHACEREYAFGFAFMRAMARVLSSRLHAVRAQLVDTFTPVGGK